MAAQVGRSRWKRRGLALAIPVALVTGCGTSIPGLPTTISCQPFGYSPAPVELPFAHGPVTQAQAEETAVALVRACGQPGPPIEDVEVASDAATGTRTGPNSGQAVWRVRVDGTVAAGGASYGSHFLIEVNQATGVPTVIGVG